MSRPDEEAVECIVDDDGRTSCCGAYTSIHMDDSVEYCKACFAPVTGHVNRPTERFTFTLPIPDGDDDD